MVTNFRFPRESGRVSHFSAWNWRVIGSLSLSVTIENRTEGGRGGAEANLTTPPYVMEETSIKVLLRAELDSSQSDESKSWERQAEVHAERLIDCSLFRPLHGNEAVNYSITFMTFVALRLGVARWHEPQHSILLQPESLARPTLAKEWIIHHLNSILP